MPMASGRVSRNASVAAPQGVGDQRGHHDAVVPWHAVPRSVDGAASYRKRTSGKRHTDGWREFTLAPSGRQPVCSHGPTLGPSPRLSALSCSLTPTATRSASAELVDDPDSARQLRALRDQFLVDRTAQPGLYGSGLNVTDQIATAVVYMRDAIPYEDAPRVKNL